MPPSLSSSPFSSNLKGRSGCGCGLKVPVLKSDRVEMARTRLSIWAVLHRLHQTVSPSLYQIEKEKKMLPTYNWSTAKRYKKKPPYNSCLPIMLRSVDSMGDSFIDRPIVTRLRACERAPPPCTIRVRGSASSRRRPTRRRDRTSNDLRTSSAVLRNGQADMSGEPTRSGVRGEQVLFVGLADARSPSVGNPGAYRRELERMDTKQR